MKLKSILFDLAIKIRKNERNIMMLHIRSIFRLKRKQNIIFRWEISV